MKQIIGLTGSLGSGCTTTANHLKDEGYDQISISENILLILSEKYKEPFGTREQKQEFGNKVRRDHRDEYEAALLETIEMAGKKVVIECFRNPIEIALIRDNFPHFYLFALFAPIDERKKRKKETDFPNLDGRDQGEKDKLGQQVRKCVTRADVVVNNSFHWRHDDDARVFFKRVDGFVKLIESPFRGPSHEELTMHLAYSACLQSHCIQRQVGAVITDRDFRVLSVGFNDVPRDSESCFELNSKCYRKIKESEHTQKLCADIKYCPFCGKALNFQAALFNLPPNEVTDEAFVCQSCKHSLSEVVAAKNLDFCRSLHAEENAILSNPYGSDGNGKESVFYIFTTTFPCMLCAKKIANAGIRRVYFVEPYPVVESQAILRECGIEIITFEGVKSLSFNRIFGERGKYLKEASRDRLKGLEVIREGAM